MSNVKTKFFYIDSNQSAFISGDYIVIEGGRLQVTMNFDWSKAGSGVSSGSGIAVAQSNNIIFTKKYKV